MAGNDDLIKGLTDLGKAFSIPENRMESFIRRSRELVGNFSGDLKNAATHAKNLGKNLAELPSLENFFKSIPGGDSFKKMFSAAGEVALETAKTFGAASIMMDKGLTAVIDPINSVNSQFSALFDGASAVETNIQNLLKTQTVAREAFTLFGGEISKVNEAASLYAQDLRRSAVATNLTTEALNSMTSSIRIIPGALELTDKGIGGITKTSGMAVQPMAVLATVSRAFGITASESARMASEAYLKYGQDIDGTIQQMGKLADAQKQTGVNIDIVRRQIDDASSNLSIFGQKSSSAANIWTTFVSSLKNTNVPLESVGNMVKSVTQGLAGMSTENRAFVSMMSGMGAGRSALGGALQMELNMRTPEGMEKNLQALTSTLSQFTGGRIVTIEEAAANPQLEMQFQVQRQMLAELNGITDREQQNRILQVLQQVQSGGMASIEGGKEVQSIFESGKNIQENELSQLKKIEQVILMSSGEATDRVIEGMNNAIGRLVPKGVRETFSRIPARAKTKTEKERKKSVETYAYTSLFKDADEKIGNFASSFIKSLDPLKEKFDDLGNAISLAISSATPPKEEIKFIPQPLGPTPPSAEKLTEIQTVEPIERRGTTKTEPRVILPRVQAPATVVLPPSPTFQQEAIIGERGSEGNTAKIQKTKSGNVSEFNYNIRVWDMNNTDLSGKIHDMIGTFLNNLTLTSLPQ